MAEIDLNAIKAERARLEATYITQGRRPRPRGASTTRR